jgi:hypothetical protein
MSRPKAFLLHAGTCLAVVMVAAVLTGGEAFGATTLCIGLLVGLYSAALDAGVTLPRLVWQSPALFRNAGLFLKWGDRRWRLLRVPLK